MALSHPALAVILVLALAMLLFGTGLILWAAWSLFWNVYDSVLERQRRPRVRNVRVYLPPPSHQVGRDCYDFKRRVQGSNK